ncbi:pilus assembly protein [Planctomicrobium sp.]|nr:pilus assembly protein [Planctomicrobium sp.]MDB4440047.1 pilus assembly protein [Planctomicrobium sp.]
MTTVEFALVLPLALFIVFGLVEFSRVNMIRNTMQNAAYEGARAGILRGGSVNKAKREAKAILATINIKNPRVRVTPDTITNETPEVEVKITVQLGDNMWVTPKYFANTRMVKSFTLTRESSQSGF